MFHDETSAQFLSLTIVHGEKVIFSRLHET